MQIVNRQVFLKMPSGTVYTKYNPVANFGEICIKKDTIAGVDWAYQALIEIEGDVLESCINAEENPLEQLKLDHNCQTKDGLYDQDQLFVILDRTDVEQIILSLQGTLK